ncbi:EF-hand calcium-binding domain-containing protein 9 [Exaiptasia diaphana]|uniref:EF-hand domain-containing protein n=1 Tax=Exaiptasia diaphana TaxID=2652724 RepID=A0A913XGC1_EXADI|nr:EF-hand calcium-binding domain-containing protein 9 [Exaiptasia diaphana]
MKVFSKNLRYMHLDKTYCLLSGKNARIVLELFRLLDVHNEMALNDLQFLAFMRVSTDLNESEIYKVFDMLDVDGSGTIDFDEFYLLVCILIAVQDNEEKHFIYRHSRTVFDLLDEDSSGNISSFEFETFGFMFNLQGKAIRDIFKEFDVSGDQELDYSEFKMFAMACIDRCAEIEKSLPSNRCLAMVVRGMEMCSIT